MASKFDLDNAYLVLNISRGLINIGSAKHPQYPTVLCVAVNTARDFAKPPLVVEFHDCNFVVINDLPNGTWFNPETKTFACHSQMHLDWQMEQLGIKPEAKAA